MELRAGEWITLFGSGAIAAFAILVGTLIYLKPPPVRFVYLESVASKRGEIVFKREGCFGCHEMLANGATYGPNLDGIGSRRTKDWLTEFMKAPRSGVSAKPYRLKMPPYNNLAPSDMRDLVSYLMAFRESQKG
jgi:cbb3-type cytochrome oxidase cytochrome c subunit